MSDLFSQDVNRPTRQSSIEAFSKGRFEDAYSQFSQLLLLYPRDPLYKYYSGVCLVEMKKNPETAAAMLEEALKGAAALRSLPVDATYFLGRAQQMSGRFSEAIDSYRKFEDQAGRKNSRDKNVTELVQQCLNKQGQLAEPEKITETGSASTVTKESVQPSASVATGRTAEGVREPLPSEYEKSLSEGLDFQFKADSLGKVTSAEKKTVGGVPENRREAELKKISESEQMAASYQKKADQRFNDAAVLKSGGTISSSSPAVEKKTSHAGQDTVRSTVKQEDRQNAGVFSVFNVVAKPVYKSDEKIPVDPDVPEGLVYRIQMAVFRNPASPSVFKGITPVYGFRITANGLTYYYAGMFRKQADASRALVTVKSKGFKDSFIVPFSGKKPISAERAAVLEKEWGNVPLFRESKEPEKIVADTVPPTLVFRIEVARSKKPLDAKKTEDLKKVAGVRGLDILDASDGTKVYLIGKFITFESAAEYNDILVRNGYRDSKVVAWLGRKEIPVETARRLFENIE